MNYLRYKDLDLKKLREDAHIDFAHYTYEKGMCSCCYGPTDFPEKYWNTASYEIAQNDATYNYSYLLFKNADNGSGRVKASDLIGAKNPVYIEWRMPSHKLDIVCDALQEQLDAEFIVIRPETDNQCIELRRFKQALRDTSSGSLVMFHNGDIAAVVCHNFHASDKAEEDSCKTVLYNYTKKKFQTVDAKKFVYTLPVPNHTVGLNELHVGDTIFACIDGLFDEFLFTAVKPGAFWDDEYEFMSVETKDTYTVSLDSLSMSLAINVEEPIIDDALLSKCREVIAMDRISYNIQDVTNLPTYTWMRDAENEGCMMIVGFCGDDYAVVTSCLSAYTIPRFNYHVKPIPGMTNQIVRVRDLSKKSPTVVINDGKDLKIGNIKCVEHRLHKVTFDTIHNITTNEDVKGEVAINDAECAVSLAFSKDQRKLDARDNLRGYDNIEMYAGENDEM